MDKIEQLSQPIEGTGSTYGVNDFIPPPVYGADEFVSELAPTSLPINNQAMIADQASTLAALSDDPENALQLYTDIGYEYSTEGKSDTANFIIEKVRSQVRENDIDHVMSIVTNPDYPDQLKRDVVAAWHDEDNKRYKPKTILAERAAVSFDPQTEDGQVHQISVLDSLDEVLDTREQIQAMMNERAAKIDSNIVKDVGELAAFWVVPFTEGVQVQEAMSSVDSEQGFFDYLSAVWKTGDKRMELQTYLRSLPPEQNLEAHRKIFEALDNSGISFGDFGEFMTAKEIVEGNYSDSDKVVDNLFSMLDVLFLGTTKVARKAIIGGAELAAKQGSGLVDKINAARRNRVRGNVNSTSVATVYGDTNPAKARDVAKAVLSDDSGVAARALMQADQGDAVAHVTMPQVGNEAGLVDNIIDAEPPEIAIARANIEETYRALRNSSATEEEFRLAVNNKIMELTNKVALVSRSPMSTISLEDGRTVIRGVYGPTHGEGGFASADEAMAAAKFAFRNFGVRDEAFKVLEQDGTHFKRVSKTPLKYVTKGSAANKRKALQSKKLKTAKFEEVQGPKSYLVEVDYDYEFNPSDIKGKMEDLRPTRTLFDRIKWMTGNQSSVTRSLLDPSSIFHPKVTETAAVASNKAAYLQQNMLKIAESVTKDWSKLPEDRIELLVNIVEEANFIGKKPSRVSMIAAGMSSKEISILERFHQFFEFEHRIKNMDKIHVQKSRGFKLFVDENGTQLEVKPLSQNSPTARSSRVRIYDHESGQVRYADQEEIEQAYDLGGGLAKVDGGVLIDDMYADYILSKNTATSYIRDIHSYDELLNKREAYYPVKYMDPHFIVRKIRTDDGERYVRIATADDKVKAAKILDKLRAENSEAEFDVFPDMKDTQNIVGNMNDTGSMGRLSSQKVRGQRLQSLNERGDLTPTSTYIMNPIDTMIYSSRVLSDRAGMRSWLETNKHRFLQTYANYLPTDEFGQPRMPNDISEIGFREKGSYDTRDLGDARAQYNYINTVENGFINLVDEGLKGLMLTMADAIGEGAVDAYRLGKHSKSDALAAFERSFRSLATDVNPLQGARRFAFAALISLNILRQWIIQANQGAQALALYPREFRKIPTMVSAMVLKHMGAGADNPFTKGSVKLSGLSETQMDRMYQSFIKSGLVAAIDNHNMVGASLRQLTEEGLKEGKLVKATLRPAKSLVKASRQVGFDAGEFVAKASAYSAAYAARLRKIGNKEHKFSQRELDEIAAEADLLTLSMNRAGEIPWNQNSLSLFFQFQSAPFKQLMLMSFTRRLDKKQKTRLALMNLALYGIPSTMVGAYLNDTGVPELKTMSKGFIDFAVNSVADAMFDEDLGNLDIQGAINPISNPFQLGIYKMALGILGGEFMPWQETPAGMFFNTENGRVFQLMNAIARYSGNWSDDAYESAPDAKALLKYAMDMSAGTSNLFQAYMFMYGSGKIDPKTGNTMINPNDKFALAKLFGINSEEANVTSWARFESYKKSVEFKKDVTKVIDTIFADAAASGITNQSEEFYTRSLAAVVQTFGNDPVVHQILRDRLKSTTYGDSWLRSAIKASGHVDIMPQLEVLRVEAKTPEERANIENVIAGLKQVRQDMKEDFEEIK